MAPETKSKKRKSGGAVASPSTKKLKKAEAPIDEEQPAPVKPSKKSKKEVSKQDENTPASESKSSRKRASDFFDGAEEDGKAAENPTDKKSKKTKKGNDDEPAPTVKAVNKKKRKAVEEPAPVEESAEEAQSVSEGSDSDNDDGEEDDQTKALLKGFESDEDEEDGQDEGDLSKVPALPDSKKLRKKLSKAKEDEAPGVIYIGRIPHGFYEHQMKAYFSQFGDITRLRLSRNKKTGRSKHYAFVEFAHADVAKIVAETMDKYLMFGHILQVRYIPADQVHPDLFKGSNRRFKAAPRNKMQGRHLRLGMDREGWDRRIEREEKRRKSKEEKLKEMGYEFEAPAIKSSSEVPKKGGTAPEPEDEAPKALAEKPHNEDQEVAEVMETVKKAKKSKKRESSGSVAEDIEPEPVKVKVAKSRASGKVEKAEKKPSKSKSKKAKTSA